MSTWHRNSGIHTQTDLFKFWQPDRVAQIYTKSDFPDTPVCTQFFQIAENSIIRSVINRRDVGKEVVNGQPVSADAAKAIEAEQKLYKRAHRKKSWFMTLVREVVWFLGKWRTPALMNFVKKVDADVYFVPIYPVVYTGLIQLHILKHYPKPYVCYLADDNYSYLPCGRNVFSYIHRFLLRKVVKALAENSTEMFTITKTEAEDTDRLFGTKSVVLTKGIDYSKLSFIPKIPDTPIRMVYTGNMFIGRASSLAAISKALGNINTDGTKMTLDIYTPTIVDDKTMTLLNSNGCHCHAPVPKDEVHAIQQAADIVVFVESLEKEHRYAARLSFSTKLTDYFSSGKCIFAIGDESIAPIVYLQENDAAVVATSYDEIEARLRELCDNPSIVTDMGRKAFDCGKRNHEINQVKSTFVNTMCRAAGKEFCR